MNDNVRNYISNFQQSVYDRITLDINEKTIDETVKFDLVKSHLDDTDSANFQNYYFLILDNEKLYYSSTDFFRQFKKMYSLQGVDNNNLDDLERHKKEILENIRSEKLAQLYFERFNKVKIKHGKGFKEKDLGSFFAKLVHTFRPNEYCALDNPIKNYFGLKKESFFISFFIISFVYKHWATDNNKLLKTIRKELQLADKKDILQHNKLTDMKLLDLIFWSKANRKQ
jgi:hypothetical protein